MSGGREGEYEVWIVSGSEKRKEKGYSVCTMLGKEHIEDELKEKRKEEKRTRPREGGAGAEG